MPFITILPHAEYCPQGEHIEAASGTSVCEALLENGIAIEHACEMSCACTTCHVVVKEGLNRRPNLKPEDLPALIRQTMFWPGYVPFVPPDGAFCCGVREMGDVGVGVRDWLEMIVR